MAESSSAAGRSSHRWLGAFAFLLAMSGILHLAKQHREREETKTALYDLGTARDPGAQLSAPAESFFCKGATPALCDLHGRWVAAAGCNDKELALASLRAALKDFRASPEYTNILFGIARVQTDTEDACNAQL